MDEDQVDADAERLLEGLRRVITITWDPETDALDIEGSLEMSMYEVYGLLTAASNIWKSTVILGEGEELYDEEADDPDS